MFNAKFIKQICFQNVNTEAVIILQNFFKTFKVCKFQINIKRNRKFGNLQLLLFISCKLLQKLTVIKYKKVLHAFMTKKSIYMQ